MSRPAPWASAVFAQVGVEARLTARRGENLLAMIGVPLAVLLYIGLFVMARGAINALLPGILAIAIVASGLVNLGIATAYERGYGVLKRLGGSPLGGSGLVAAKVVVILVIALAQVAGLLAVAASLGWRPGPGASVALLVLATITGAVAFAGLGLTISALLRPEGALVAANGLFLLALGFGGTLIPMDLLPAPMASAMRLSPVNLLAEAFAVALGSGADIGRPLVILGAWAVAATLLAARTFRWD